MSSNILVGGDIYNAETLSCVMTRNFISNTSAESFCWLLRCSPIKLRNKNTLDDRQELCRKS